MLPQVLAEPGELLQITELIRTLLNARVSQVLIVAGLVFLGFSIVGDISGKIEMGTNSRIAGGVAGSLLVITGLGMHIAYAGGGGDGIQTSTAVPTPEATATPAATPTPTVTPTLPPTTEPVTYPAGFDESGYTDPKRALERHLQVLRTRSFTGTTLFESDTEGTTELVVRADPETRRVYKVARRDGSVEAELFFDSGTVDTRTPGDQGFNSDVTSYDWAVVFDGQYEDIVSATLRDPEVTRERGRTLITYDATGKNIEGTLTITETGLYLRYSLRVESDQGAYSIRYRVTDLGETTVEEPKWVKDS